MSDGRPYRDNYSKTALWEIACLDFCHFQYPQVGLPLVKPIKRIVVGAKVLRQPVLPSNGAVEHPAECYTIDGARMNAEPNDPARVLIHDHQDPMGPQRGRLAPE